MSERTRRILSILLIFVMCVSYFGCGYYFGVVDRPRRHPPITPPAAATNDDLGVSTTQ